MNNNVLPTARELTSHRVNGLNEALRIFVLDHPGAGGACHEYVILQPMDGHDIACEEHDTSERPSSRYRVWSKPVGGGDFEGTDLHVGRGDDVASLVRFNTSNGDAVVRTDHFNYTRISFQNGPIKEQGVNGISQEALIAVLVDRLTGFQSGQFKCRDNDVALTHLESAALWLHKRTLERVARNVEGTNQQ